MADIASALHARLAAALSADLGTRIYPVAVPQNAVMPYARYQVVSDPRPQNLRGYDSARQTRVQVDIFDKSYGTARRIATALIAAMAPPATVAGVRFGRTRAEGPRDLGEDTANGFVNRASVDLLAEHTLA